MNLPRLSNAALTLLTACTVGAAPVVVFDTDFNGAVPAQISGITTTESVQGYAGLGPVGNQFGGNLLRNTGVGATTLSLNGLPAHDSVDLNFLLAVIDSWDGLTTSGGTVPPDFFNIQIDGGAPIQMSFDFRDPADQGFIPAGATQLSYGAHLGFSGNWEDGAYDMGTAGVFSFPHSASTLTVSFFASGGGFQGGADESWGIDNLSVSIDARRGVPETGSTLLMLFSGLIGTLALKRRFARL